ncbi:MAG TPA: succinate dehydrogenase/fumarate reductase flavoprotein subunit [Chloroflexi bacterium]|nr:succinate dehydrogenase/fumarate reductase flavoprotein subunit [Chloroflexota bacterium]
MSYTPEMRESIRKVEATRQRRLKEIHPRIPPQEQEEVLKRFHPDYVEGGMRELLVGPNRGDRTPIELADLLEGRSHIEAAAFDLGRVDYECDVLVIGGGGAGASAALLAQENGAQVILTTKLRFGDANTMMAQGGIQAADKPNDSPAIHYLDVMGGGHFTNVPALVEALVMDAPSVIQWLEDLGCMFDKEPDGTMRTIHGGGTSRKRMHFARDYSGAEIMRTLRDEVRNRQISVVEFAPVVELVMDDKGQVAGAILLNLETGDYSLVKSKTVIIASGGGGRLHYQGFPTTNHYGATADGLVLAYRVGAKLAFIDTMQYHPTGAAYPEQILGQLVTEKVRGLGAQLVNVEGEQFVYPLETRDVESAAIIRECIERKKGVVTPTGQQGVWLDSPMIDILKGSGTIQTNLPAMVRQFGRFDIDMTKEPILVYPTLHYQNGGIAIKPDGSTDIPNLYVAGEVAGGVHGRNRLMGNSLLEITVYGRRAGKAAALRAKEVELGELTLEHLRDWERQLKEANLEPQIVSPLLLPDYTRHTRPVSMVR